MKKVKKITKVTYEVQKIVCNKCEKEIDLDKDDIIEANLFHSFKVGFGYGSDYDMEEWTFDLCEDCLLDFIKTFKIEPDKVDYDNRSLINRFMEGEDA